MARALQELRSFLTGHAFRIIVCGGGIIGAATAYYLSELGHGPNLAVVEQEAIACAASGDVCSGLLCYASQAMTRCFGTAMQLVHPWPCFQQLHPVDHLLLHHASVDPAGKAGGFLALDWQDHSPAGPLSRVSFALHEALAQKFGAERIDYRKVNTLSVSRGFLVKCLNHDCGLGKRAVLPALRAATSGPRDADA